MRCRQVQTLFDVPPQDTQTLRWAGDVPLEAQPWHVGLITGPSGCARRRPRARSSVEALRDPLAYAAARGLRFPARPLNEIADICQCRLQHDPACCARSRAQQREQFRAMLARRLLETPRASCSMSLRASSIDSGEDRQRTRGRKYVRAHDTQFVAISCHHDIID